MRSNIRRRGGFDMMDLMGSLVPYGVALFFIGFVGFGAFALYDEYVSEKFYLRKDQFHCSASHIEITYDTHTTTNANGTTSTVTTPREVVVCDVYTRNGHGLNN